MQYQFNYPTFPADDARELVAFFHGRRGKQRAFLMKAWDDFEAENEVIGTGDGADTTFQLIKTYDTVNPWTRTIRHVMPGSLSVTVNNVPATVSSEVNGLVTLSSPPANGHIVRATFRFYVAVRFENDDFDIQMPGPQDIHARVSNLVAREVRE
jgi:uncharacterized protein (TIGR02217 family)